jgi:hypothetical protein
MIHILAQHGCKWMPGDSYEINDARRCFLKMSNDYIVEFIWIMAKYNACSRENIEPLAYGHQRSGDTLPNTNPGLMSCLMISSWNKIRRFDILE